ncbi:MULTISPECIES: HNH endonuclease signature motif containing protein [unclassified Corynebacterium]|uniref:HNH endonuclease signature motif containing protein n=1 Tax=unclassified Corynebacterium TaxID=2624378 RepID=UPI001EF642DE|nr:MULTISPECIES: HNH endonuclease signature motif containing protein [unclassified Corynebacterium]MCG7258115.1 HNH endonuclease [Corynebacterium sp. ACRQK]MCG7262548.1 HNH endonuclease [Corynebacterium sp. ACRQL]
MEKLQQLAELKRQVADAQSHGVELLTEAIGTPAEQLPLEREYARSVARAAEHFSGAAYSRYKKRALEAAQRNGHGLDVLILIAERARALGIKQRYVFTEALCNTTGDYAAISRRATQLRREMQGPRVPDDGGRRIMHGTKTTIQFTGPSHRMSEVWESARLDPLAWLTENRTIQRSTLTTNVVVSLDDYMQILSGRGDEIELCATNGAVLTGAEYVARRLEDAVSSRQLSTPIAEASIADAVVADSTSAGSAGVAGSTSVEAARVANMAGSAGAAGSTSAGPAEMTLTARSAGAAGVAGEAKTAGVMLKDGDCITLIAPEQGPVNLYRAKRLASSKQRRMLEAETSRCAWPGCGRPASECQVHHLQEFAKGGETNPENMTLLCPYHNGVNGQRGRGRMAREHGRVTWLPPGSPGRGEPPEPLEPPSPPGRGEPPEPPRPPGRGEPPGPPGRGEPPSPPGSPGRGEREPGGHRGWKD